MHHEELLVHDVLRRCGLSDVWRTAGTALNRHSLMSKTNPLETLAKEFLSRVVVAPTATPVSGDIDMHRVSEKYTEDYG